MLSNLSCNSKLPQKGELLMKISYSNISVEYFLYLYVGQNFSAASVEDPINFSDAIAYVIFTL